MTTQDKTQIASKLEKVMERSGLSQNKWARVNGLSSANVSQVLKGNWDHISDAMWRKFAHATGYTTSGWRPAETRDFKLLTKTLRFAQNRSLSLGISHNAGSGKTFACRYYKESTPNAFYLNCGEHFTKKVFLQKLGKSMGLDVDGMKATDMIDKIIDEAGAKHKPLFILDEADKLNDRVLMYFIELYNNLDGKCGFVLIGAPFLRKRVETGAKKDKMGFREIYSRIGKRFLQMHGASKADVEAICEANEITEPELVAEIFNEANGDLRRVARMVTKFKLKTQKEAA